MLINCVIVKVVPCVNFLMAIVCSLAYIDFELFLQILALIIITLPVYFKVNALLKSWPINGGIIAAGVFLLIVAIAGIYGSWRQHQIILFFVSFHKESSNTRSQYLLLPTLSS